MKTNSVHFRSLYDIHLYNFLILALLTIFLLKLLRMHRNELNCWFYRRMLRVVFCSEINSLWTLRFYFVTPSLEMNGMKTIYQYSSFKSTIKTYSISINDDFLYTLLHCSRDIVHNGTYCTHVYDVITIRSRIKLKYLFKILVLHNILMSQKPNYFNVLH